MGEEDSQLGSLVMDPKDASIVEFHQNESIQIENGNNIDRNNDQAVRNDSTCTEVYIIFYIYYFLYLLQCCYRLVMKMGL